MQTAANRMEIITWILEHHQCVTVSQSNPLEWTDDEDHDLEHPLLVDALSANAYNTVHQALKPHVQDKLDNAPWHKAMDVVWSCIK